LNVNICHVGKTTPEEAILAKCCVFTNFQWISFLGLGRKMRQHPKDRGPALTAHGSLDLKQEIQIQIQIPKITSSYPSGGS
jgi:hypothetical protein